MAYWKSWMICGVFERLYDVSYKIMTTVPLWIGTVCYLYALQHCLLYSFVVVAHKVFIVEFLQQNFGKRCSIFVALSMVENAISLSAIFSWVFPLFCQAIAQRIGEIIQHVYVKLPKLLQHVDKFRSNPKQSYPWSSRPQTGKYCRYQVGHLVK